MSTAAKRLRGLGGNESVERTDRALFDQFAYLGFLHFAAADDLVDHELAILRFVAAQRFPQRLAVGRRKDVGHARDGVVFLEILHAIDDAFRLLDDLGHEFLARKFPVLHLAELDIPIRRSWSGW